MPSESPPKILIVGASRGLGLAIASEFLDRGWDVVGSVRSSTRTGLHDLAEAYDGRVEVETLDIDATEQIAALRDRLSGRRVDMLFVNAGTTTRDPDVRIGEVDSSEFARVMTTNALSPMRVVETLHDLVPAGGLIGLMSSGQGSIANNETGLREVYRASKAALNMLMRSFAARQTDPARAMVLMAPGWTRTELGGPSAPFGNGRDRPADRRHVARGPRDTGLALPRPLRTDRSLVNQRYGRLPNVLRSGLPAWSHQARAITSSMRSRSALP